MREPVSSQSAEHYTWLDQAGVPCDGWHLVRTAALSVIEENMPPGTSERRHLHIHAHQFFYVLQGVFTLELDGQTHTLQAGQGLEVAPGTPHQAHNRSGEAVRFLVTSQPPSHGDRTYV